jgi:N-methylhydantoinase B
MLHQGTAHRQLHGRAWVSREAVIADNGVVLTGELDDDSRLDVAAATGAAPASGPAPAEVFPDRGPEYVRLFGGRSCAEVGVVAS